jgi:hypothetical protein
MNKLPKLFKKYASGALFLVVLLSPLQSFAAVTTQEVMAFRQQVDLVLEAIETSTTIPAAKKSEFRVVIYTINDALSVLARRAAANPENVSPRPFVVQDDIFTGSEANFFSDLTIN